MRARFQIGAVLNLIRQGYRFRRESWPPRQWLEYRPPDAVITSGWLRLHCARGHYAVWEPTQPDLLADDWLRVSHDAI